MCTVCTGGCVGALVGSVGDIWLLIVRLVKGLVMMMVSRDSWGTRAMSWGYMNMVKPVVFAMKPDRAHDATIVFCRMAQHVPGLLSLLNWMIGENPESLGRDLMGLHFPNPIGLSAGMDKTGDLSRVLDAAGFGFGSFGSLTAEPCDGNPRPWYHRLPQYDSLLIHAGIPNAGVREVTRKTDKAHGKLKHGMVTFGSVAFNNKPFTKPDGSPDYDAMIEDFALAYRYMAESRTDVIEVNVSCPNVSMGKPFSDTGRLDDLFTRLDGVDRYGKPVMVKLRTTGDPHELAGNLDVLASHHVDGVSVCNLLEDRTGYDVPESWEGSLSGAPCREQAVNITRFIRREYGDRFVINSIGGTMNADDAKAKLDAGADLLGAITVFMYRGPQMISTLKNGIR